MMYAVFRTGRRNSVRSYPLLSFHDGRRDEDRWRVKTLHEGTISHASREAVIAAVSKSLAFIEWVEHDGRLTNWGHS